MLLAGLLTLAVPLVAWQSVRELDASLEQGRAVEQRLALARLQLALRGEDDVRTRAAMAAGGGPRVPGEIYAEPARAPIMIDGYADDWHELGGPALRLGGADGADELSLGAAERGGRLYLSIEIDDAQRVYHRPPPLAADAGEGELPSDMKRLANGDALQLFVASATQTVHAMLSPIAPGELQVRLGSRGRDRRRVMGQILPHWQAAWVERPGGHRIEVSLPMPADPARIGLSWRDVDRRDGQVRELGTMTGYTMQRLHGRTPRADALDRLPRLYRNSPAVQRLLQRLVPAGARVRAFDVAGRALGDVDRLNARAIAATEGSPVSSPFDSLADALLFRVFAFLVAGDLPLSEGAYASTGTASRPPSGIEPRDPALQALQHTQRYVTPALDRVLGTLIRSGTDATGGAGEPGGWLWYETNEEHSAAYSGSRLARLFSLVVLASVIASCLLLGWAAWLSMRIRRLSRSATRAVSADGRVMGRGFAASRARDELGELSRGVAALLDRSGDYHRHLEAMASRLSHELRTPLAVVRSSLELLRASVQASTDPGRHAQPDQRADQRADQQADQQADQRSDQRSDLVALLERAEGGAHELDAMLRSLIASTRLEQTVERAERRNLSLDQLFRDGLTRYRQIYPDVRVGLSLDRATRYARVHAAPELLVQALDKLVDNAVDHADAQGLDLCCRTNGPQVFIGVRNRTQPAHLADDRERAAWFDPMHSLRAATDDRRIDPNNARHLGLGLHLVQLIARGHGGDARAQQSRGWTCVGVWLPRC